MGSPMGWRGSGLPVPPGRGRLRRSGPPQPGTGAAGRARQGRSLPWAARHPYQAHSRDAFKQQERETPAQRQGDSDRSCPLGTGLDRPMWHASGTAGEHDGGSGLAVTVPARAMGEARPGQREPRWKPPEVVRQIGLGGRPPLAVTESLTTPGWRRSIRSEPDFSPARPRASGIRGWGMMRSSIHSRPARLADTLLVVLVGAPSPAWAGTPPGEVRPCAEA
jgi:hypothetical protein